MIKLEKERVECVDLAKHIEPKKSLSGQELRRNRRKKSRKK